MPPSGVESSRLSSPSDNKLGGEILLFYFIGVIMLNKVILSVAAGVAGVLSTLPAFASGPPRLAWSYVTTGYGQLGCIQRAESKLYQIGATNVGRNNNINVFGSLVNERIGIACRGTEAIIIVAGDDPFTVRDEVYKAF